MDFNFKNTIPKKSLLNKIEENIEILYDSKDSSFRWEAQKFLTDLQYKWESFELIYSLLESKRKQTIFFGLKLLDQILNQKWEGISIIEKKSLLVFLIKKIFFYASGLGDLNENSPNITKLNLTFVKIIGKENKNHFLTILSELTSSAKISELICENNLRIIQIIFEEIQEEISIKTPSKSFFSNFMDFFFLKRVENLCCFIFQQSGFLVHFRPGLIVSALNAFEKILFFSDFPNYHILPLSLDSLISLCSEKNIRNHSLNCLFELENQSQKFDQIFRKKIIKNFMIQFQELLPLSCDFVTCFNSSEQEFRHFIMNSITFFLKIWKAPDTLFSGKGFSKSLFLLNQQFFLKISCLPHLEIFKVCLEWWDFFINHLEKRGVFNSYQRFSEFLFSDLVIILIGRMAKPEEILIRENETGEIIREKIKDTDSNVLYKKIKNILIILVQLDRKFAQHIILKKLSLQFEKKNWSRIKLSTICWSVGSISGIFPLEEEKIFLVGIIKDLLYLCELKKGKDNKAVIASNIMFVVGSYPQFLQHHWKFLKTVLEKLFEFMREHHPGIQDMACDTFLKIGKSCAKKISSFFEKDEPPLIEDILIKGEGVIGLLEFRQKRQFFEGICSILLSIENSDQKNFYISKIFELLNKEWFSCLKPNIFFKKPEILNQISILFKLNRHLGDFLKNSYNVFLGNFLKETYFIYVWASEEILKKNSISNLINSEIKQDTIFKNLKKGILGMVQNYLLYSTTDLNNSLMEANFHKFIQPILLIYKNSSTIELKDPDVLSFCKIILEKLKLFIQTEMVRAIFSHTFLPSLKFVQTGFEENLDLRKNFYDLIQVLVFDFFPEIFKLDTDPIKAEISFELIVHSLIWGFKHPDNLISKNSLESLLHLTTSLKQKSFRKYFFFKFTKPILNDLFAVLVDGLHFSCFKLHCKLFFELLQFSKEYSDISCIQIDLAIFFSNALPGLTQKELDDLTISLLNEADEINFVKKILLIIKIDPIYQQESNSEN